ncbi:MAG: glycosyltransferase family 39 protein [Deltaproteobacteria bacterium]|nr:glycosyltransferase family 39 protein [Deltaproteobacteria bacterium]
MSVVAKNIKIIAVLALFGAVMLGNLGGWELKGADEPRYAQIAREMRETGQYIVPHLNAEMYPDKPPLFFWLMALSAVPSGDVSAFEARLPSVLAGLGLILLTYMFAARLFDPGTGLLAAGVLFCCEQFFSTTTSAHFDTILAFWTTLSLLLLYIGYTRAEKGKKYMLGGYIAMGAALLTKGPVGLVIPLASMLLFVLARKELGRIKDLHIVKGLIIAIGILAAWLVPACIMGGEAYTQNILFQQTFGRTVESFAHKEAFYYYFLGFPVDFLPWSFFVPAAAVYFWKYRSRNKEILLPVIWFVFTFVMFTLVSGKRNLYLLPLYPAAAMLMAKFFTDCIRSEELFAGLFRSKLFMVPCYLIAGALPAAGVAGIVMLVGNIGPVKNIEAGRWLLFAAACFVCALGFVWLRKRQDLQLVRRMPYLIVACTTLVYGLFVGVILPATTEERPEHAFCETIRKTVQPEDKLFATFSPYFFNYFLPRYPISELRDAAMIRTLLDSPARVYCLSREKDYAKLPDDIKSKIKVLEEETIGHKIYYLLVNTHPHNDG